MITLFGKTGCVFCVKAKNLCSTKKVPFNYVTLTEELKNDLESKLKRTFRTVPIIVKDEEYLGGYTELEAYLKGE